MVDQRSLLDQLSEVIILANQHGYYDAADWIGARLRECAPRRTNELTLGPGPRSQAKPPRPPQPYTGNGEG